MSAAPVSPFSDLLRQLGEECLDMLRDLAAQGDKNAAELLERIEALRPRGGGVMGSKYVEGPYLRDGRTVYALVPMLPQDRSKGGPKECNSFFCTVQGCNGKYSATEEQLEATAALFAAAPELLKALETLLGALCETPDGRSSVLRHVPMAMDTARAAIAKALGGAK